LELIDIANIFTYNQFKITDISSLGFDYPNNPHFTRSSGKNFRIQLKHPLWPFLPKAFLRAFMALPSYLTLNS
jgi:hypothetical protein